MTTRTIDIHEARQYLPELLAQVAAGEEIVIAEAGKHLARLSPVLGQPSAKSERVDWTGSQAEALSKVWLNDADAIYDRL